ncbi:MAG: transposase [Rhodobacteraceae bacterium]|nr:transposase [Paracoccaceae bacterium]
MESPSKSNRKPSRPLDREICGMHNLVERFFSRIKEFRRIATRCDKIARNFLSADSCPAGLQTNKLSPRLGPICVQAN